MKREVGLPFAAPKVDGSEGQNGGSDPSISVLSTERPLDNPPGEDSESKVRVIDVTELPDGSTFVRQEIASDSKEATQPIAEAKTTFGMGRIRRIGRRMAPLTAAAAFVGLISLSDTGAVRSSAEGTTISSSIIATTSTGEAARAAFVSDETRYNSLQNSIVKTESMSVKGVGEVKVSYNVKDLPVMFTFSDGQELYPDQQKVEELKKKAQAEGQPQLIDVAVVKTDYRYRGSNKDLDAPSIPLSISGFEDKNPILQELPSDVLTDIELKEKNIAIIQGGESKLYLRPSIFNKNEALEAMNPQTEINAAGDEKLVTKQKSLTIIVTETFGLFKQLMTGEAKTITDKQDWFPTFPQDIIDSYVQLEIGRLNKQISSLEKKIEKAKDQEAKMELEQQVMDIQPILAAFSEGKFPIQQLIGGAIENSSYLDFPEKVKKEIKVGGYWTRNKDGDNYIYFLTCSMSSNIVYGIYLDKDGNVQVNPQITYYGGEKGSGVPPNSNYLSCPTPGHYLSPGGSSILEILKHETYHFYNSSHNLPNSEDDTNMRTLWDIKAASDTFENSDYKDSSEYSLVLTLPNWLGKGYILD